LALTEWGRRKEKGVGSSSLGRGLSVPCPSHFSNLALRDGDDGLETGGKSERSSRGQWELGVGAAGVHLGRPGSCYGGGSFFVHLRERADVSAYCVRPFLLPDFPKLNKLL
jgi:hypothetical protein